MRLNTYLDKDCKTAINAFNETLRICDYHNVKRTMGKKTDDYIVAMSIFDNVNCICNISLYAADDYFAICVAHAFYEYHFKFVEDDVTLLAYLIRNATKPVDAYDESITFFMRFFAEHPDYQDVNAVQERLVDSIEESMSLTYVDGNAFNDNRRTRYAA